MTKTTDLSRKRSFTGVRARGLGGGYSPQTRLGGKVIIFRAKAKFFGQKPATKMKKKFFLHLLNEKTEFVPSSEIKCPKSGIF